MRCPATVLLLLLPLAGCSGWTIIISPSGVPSSSSDHRPSPTSPPPLRTIGIGESAEGTLSSSHPAEEFDVTVIADGSLVVHVRWVDVHSSTILLLKVGDTEFRNPALDGSSVVGRVPVKKGHRYRLHVGVQGSESIPDNLYRLTTAVE
jgi:hypothetical protein